MVSFAEDADYEVSKNPAKNPTTGLDESDDEDVEIDAEGMKKSKIEPLPRIDHSALRYRTFTKAFYKENPAITAMSDEEVSKFMKDEEIHVNRPSPRPIRTFQQAGFDRVLLEEIGRLGYTKPTAIQSQALPLVLSGCDVLGLAKTGSGKTLAFTWPMLAHVLRAPQMQLGDGPVGLILSPTRELANQIYSEVKRFAKVFNIRVAVVYGGAGKWEMTKALKEAPEIVVATPGRLIEMVRIKATNLHNVTMAVLDEADRMFEMGFEYQMRSIMQNIRPDRQLLMFSATMKKRIESFAREIFNNEVRIVIGTIGQANLDIRQEAVLLPSQEDKWPWLATRIDEFAADGKVLIFVLSKAGTDEVAARLKAWFAGRQLDIGVDCLHGDKDQTDRSKIMHKFCKTDDLPILVATDIAARGLDVKDVRTVINYDVAKNIDTYVHRIGRTGRMGVEGIKPGTAYTLLTSKESSFAVDLVHNLRMCQQAVPADLLQLAAGDPKWSRGHGNSKHSKGMGLGAGQQAMTSAMMASQTGGRAGSSSSGFQKSAAPSSSSSSSSSSAWRAADNSISANAVGQRPASTTSVRGFVAASTAYHSVNSLPAAAPSSNAPGPAAAPGRKRSRWDT